MKTKVIPSKWLEKEGFRLDCNPYMSGAIEAKLALENIKCVPLIEIVEEKEKGIFNGPRFKRIFLDDPKYSINLVSGADMLQADLNYTDRIAKFQAKKMPEMLLKEGTTLISSYGTVGRCVYTRPDMVKMIGSDNVLKVIPDRLKVLSGYLFAYLSSKYGVPMIIKGEGGAVVTYLDPTRVYDLPVPRLGEVEEQVHNLVQQAADSHLQSIKLREEASNLLNLICGFPQKMTFKARNLAFSTASSCDIVKRFDATFHNPIAQEAEFLVSKTNPIPLINAGIEAYESNRLKQVFVEPGYGTPFITSGGIFLKTITPERYLKNTLLGDKTSWEIEKYDTLLARSGQVGGIIGRGIWADSRFNGFAASPHILRIRTDNPEYPPGYVYTFLCLTDVGYHLLVRLAAGSSIPFLPAEDVLAIKIPNTPTIEERNKIDTFIKDSGELRKEAQNLETKAIDLVETAIEEGAR